MLDTLVWVPVIWTEDTGYIANALDVAFTSVIPVELDAKRVDAGRPLTQYVPIMVNAADLAKLPVIIAEQDVPEEERLLIELCRKLARTPEGTIDEAAVDTFFDSVPGVSTGSLERKQMVVELLERAGRRGLSAEKRLEIAERLNIADVELPQDKTP